MKQTFAAFFALVTLLTGAASAFADATPTYIDPPDWHIVKVI